MTTTPKDFLTGYTFSIRTSDVQSDGTQYQYIAGQSPADGSAFCYTLSAKEAETAWTAMLKTADEATLHDAYGSGSRGSIDPCKIADVDAFLAAIPDGNQRASLALGIEMAQMNLINPLLSTCADPDLEMVDVPYIVLTPPIKVEDTSLSDGDYIPNDEDDEDDLSDYRVSKPPPKRRKRS